jgi:hypothetical protein
MGQKTNKARQTKNIRTPFFIQTSYSGNQSSANSISFDDTNVALNVDNNQRLLFRATGNLEDEILLVPYGFE